MNAQSKEVASSSSIPQPRRAEENYSLLGYEKETNVDGDIDLELPITSANDQTCIKKKGQKMNFSSGGQLKKQGQRGPGRKGKRGVRLVDPNKRCLGCQTTSTPLWRRGPLGCQTLCNACGLRYWKEEKNLSTKLTLGPP